MGTFHRDTHPLHGITCVAEGRGSTTWIGRVDHVEGENVVLLDVDVHEASAAGPTRAEWIAKTASVGPWRKHARIAVPLADVVSLRPLSQYAAS